MLGGQIKERVRYMNNGVFALKKIARATVALGAVLVTSCSPPPSQHTAAPVTAPSEIGRFHIVVSSEGERGSVLFLVDTKDGATWIYRPPQGPAINGFWSDIPRVTYPPDFWQRAFQMMSQPPQATGSNAPPARPGAPSPAPTVTPSR